ncbi:MAG: single-stranded-DNA-specific exonuclease RecJ [Proteobacteria bacterium]|nr:single-stranded-DNA-specific exonuclease RecJ [Pseudomonadota bacterium]
MTSSAGLRPADPSGTTALASFAGVERSATGRRWVMAEPDQRMTMALAQSLGVSEIVARVLAERGISLDDAGRFLNPTLRDLLPDPSRFKDLDKAVGRIADAIKNGERIALFGDYDVDGATSSAILSRFLCHAGAPPLIHIPDRIKEGYGPNAPAMRALAGKGAKLVLTLDCGTTSFEPLAEARDAGLDVIIVDHHEPEPALPPVFAVVNPNRLDEDGAYGQLCTAGLAFVLAVGLNRELRARGHWTTERPEPDLTQWLDMAALGTVCDVVPLTGLNRAIVTQGLKVMARRDNIGLTALADVASMREQPAAYHLGFILGPRINAGGRIGQSDLGVRLLTTEDAGEAAALATRLDILNAERQEIERAVLDDALNRIASRGEPGAVVVTAGDGWHPGVVGIVASRLVEKFGRPACVVAVDGGRGTGSGRSVAGVDLGACIIAARQKGLLLKGGGHSMAAGFTVKREAIEDFAEFLNQRIAAKTGGGRVVTDLKLSAELAVRGANIELASEITQLAPFGPGNPEPRVAIKDVRVAYASVVGADHIKCTLSGSGGGNIDGIAYRAVDTELGRLLLSKGGAPIHVAGRLKLNTWQGRSKAELQIEDAAAVWGE